MFYEKDNAFKVTVKLTNDEIRIYELTSEQLRLVLLLDHLKQIKFPLPDDIKDITVVDCL